MTVARAGQMTTFLLLLCLACVSNACQLIIKSEDNPWFNNRRFYMHHDTYKSRPVYINEDNPKTPLYLYFTSDEAYLHPKWIISNETGSNSGIAVATSYALTPTLFFENEELEWKVVGEHDWAVDISFSVSCVDFDLTVWFQNDKDDRLQGYWVQTGMSSHGRRVWMHAGQHSSLYMYYITTAEIEGRWVIGYDVGSLKGVYYTDTTKQLWEMTLTWDSYHRSADDSEEMHDYHVWFGQNEEGSAWEPDAECLLIMGRNDLITPLLANDSPTGQADVIKQVVQFRKWKQHNFQLWEGMDMENPYDEPPQKTGVKVKGGYYELNNKIKMPQVLFGTRSILDRDQVDMMTKAYQVGYRGFDLSPEHNNTKFMRKVLKSRFHKIDRSELFITIKIWPEHLGFIPTLNEALRQIIDMDTDYADLILIQYPKCEDVPYARCDHIMKDPETYSWLNSYRALEYLYATGRTHAIGISNFGGDKLDDLLNSAGIIPHVLQNWMDPVHTESHILSTCKMYKVHFQAYSTLNYIANFTAMRNYPKYMDFYRHVKPVATRLKRTYIQVALKWFIQRGISVLPRTNHLEYLVQNYDLWDWNLTVADIQQFSQHRHNNEIEHLHDTNVEYVLRQGRQNAYKQTIRKSAKKRAILKDKRLRNDTKRPHWITEDHEEDKELQSLEQMKDDLDKMEGKKKVSLNYVEPNHDQHKPADWKEAQTRKDPISPGLMPDKSVERAPESQIDMWEEGIQPVRHMDPNHKNHRDYQI